MSTTLLQEAQAFQTELIEWRRTLHMNPELDMDLPVTVAFVKDKLTEMGITCEVCELSLIHI